MPPPWPMTRIGLDLTHQALATPEVIERIGALGTPLAATTVELMHFFTSTYKAMSGFGSPPVHDPCAVARVIDPKLVECIPTYVTVETHGATTSGMTLVDFENRFGREANGFGECGMRMHGETHVRRVDTHLNAEHQLRNQLARIRSNDASTEQPM